MTVRIGSVPYLNSKVLIYGLEPAGHTPDGTPYSLELLPPNQLAKKLAAGGLDIALASVIEYFRHPEYTLLPDHGVCGAQRMWSIQLFHRVPLKEIHRVALDPASETTNALVRIVLEQQLGLKPQYVASDTERSLTDPALAVDAFLKIGDPCLRLAAHAPGWQTLDLLSQWHALTHLPFVFAAWLVRGGADLHGVPELLRRAKVNGFAYADGIAEAWHTQAGISRERALIYVQEIVRYDLGASEIEGLREFQKRLLGLGLLVAERPVGPPRL